MVKKEIHVKKADDDDDDDDDEKIFFSVFQPGFNSETLKIPPGFINERTNRVILSSYCRREEGRCWGVELYEFSKDKVYFDKGWENFVEDHHLHEGDFVVFKYEGGICFSVRIFEKNGVEKVYSSNDTIISIKDEGETSNYKRPRNQQTRQGGKKITSDHATPGRTPPYRSRKDDDIVQRKTKSFSSRNPFFSRLLKDYNVNTSYTLSIPKATTKNIFSEGTKEVTLKNKQGRAWEVMIITSNGQKFFIPRGWKSFVVDNSLKVGDVCIFELVGEAVLQVHVF